MKYLETNLNGGQPIYLDDLRYIQSSLIEAIEAQLSFLSSKYKVIIISGCVATPSTFPGQTDISSGYIYFEGELLRFPSVTLPNPSVGNVYSVITSIIDNTNGSRTFQNGDNNEVFKEKIAVISVDPAGTLPADQQFNSLPNIKQVISNIDEIRLNSSLYHFLDIQESKPLVISGCYMSGLNQITEGYVLYQGQIYHVSEKTFNDISGSYYPVELINTDDVLNSDGFMTLEISQDTNQSSISLDDFVISIRNAVEHISHYSYLREIRRNTGQFNAVAFDYNFNGIGQSRLPKWHINDKFELCFTGCGTIDSVDYSSGLLLAQLNSINTRKLNSNIAISGISPNHPNLYLEIDRITGNIQIFGTKGAGNVSVWFEGIVIPLFDI